MDLVRDCEYHAIFYPLFNLLTSLELTLTLRGSEQ